MKSGSASIDRQALTQAPHWMQAIDWVTSIIDSYQAEFKAAGEKMHAAREGMQALLEADTLDEAAVRAKSVEVAAAEADAAILGAKVREQTVQVLTSEQLAKLKELQKTREGQPRKQRGPGRH